MLTNFDKDIFCLIRKRKIKVNQNAKFAQIREINWGAANYANLKIAKPTCRENFM